MAAEDSLTAPMEGATSSSLGGIQVDVVDAANGRLKRVIWPAGARWSRDLKPAIGAEADLCMHAHVGFLARGKIEGEYHDGCTFSVTAPAALVLEPGHDAWVVGDEDAVFVQFDYEGETAKRFGLPEKHSH
jgi:hypothetical protein